MTHDADYLMLNHYNNINMRKNLLRLLTLLSVIIGGTAVTWAENVVYALIPSSSMGTKVTSFDYDAVNTTDKLTIAATGEELTGVDGVYCSVNVGNKYYAFINNEYATGSSTMTQLVTINFTTDNVTVVNDKSYGWGNPGYMPCGMAYDKQTNMVYVIEKGYDESDNAATFLYSLDLSNGALTEINHYTGTYEAITSDGKGGFYLVKNHTVGYWPYPELFHMEMFAIDEEPCIPNETVSCSSNSNRSFCLSEDGTFIVYTSGTSVFEFNLEAKTFEKKGTLSKSIAGLTFKCSTEDGDAGEISGGDDDQPKRVLLSKTWYGDAMGTENTDVDMKKEIYFYGYDGKINATGNYGRNYGSSESNGGNSNDPGWYVPMYYTKNVRDDRGNIVKTTRYQYGQYDFGDMSMKVSRDYSYEYDEQNRLIKDSIENYKTVYLYDENNNIVKDTVYYSSNGGYMCDHQYFEFIAVNKPTMVVSNGKWDADKYTAFIEYDENGNKTSETRYKVIEGDFGLTEYVPTKYEGWTYEGDVLVLYEMDHFDSKTGEPVPYIKIEYEAVDGDSNKLLAKEYSYNSSTDKWYEQGLPCLYTYGYFDDMLDMTRIEFMAEKSDVAVNDVDLVWSVPMLAYSAPASEFIVYRNGEAIDTLGIMECLDFDSSYCKYTDRFVKSGKHDYFVLPRFGQGEIIDETDIVWTHYYASDIVEVDATIELPAVSNLELTGARVVREGEGLDVYDITYGTIKWTNPEGMEDLEFISNDLMLDNFQLAEASTAETTTTSLEGVFENDETDVYVLTRYAYGKAVSEHITVRLTDLTEIVGINGATTDGEFLFNMNDRQILVGENANATVFDVAGSRVAKASAGSIDLGNLTAGNYILMVEKDGKVKGYKFQVK